MHGKGSTVTDTAPFSDPAVSVGFDYKEHLNALLLFTVHGFETAIKTAYGDNDAVRCDIVTLDGPDAGTEVVDTLVFPRALIGQLRPKVGGMVLGRLGQGTAKPGQSPAWLLSAPTDTDRELGVRWLNRTPKVAEPPF